MPFDVSKLRSPDGEFELVVKLGEGNYGAVYKGQSTKTKKAVAVKVIEYDEEDEGEIAMEVDILEICHHPNIVGYFGTFFKLGKIWMVMELCQAGSLVDIYTANKGLKEEHISFVCHEMLQGLHYLHENGIIHRDVKGGNVLLTMNGEVKLADFGVSAITDASTRDRNSFIGTPYWMGPEMIACDKDPDATYNEKADIWALGITAIEMAEMNPPLADFHPFRALFLIPTSPSPTLKSPKKWSKEFNDFLRYCLIKDPAQRPSAQSLLKHKFMLNALMTQKKSVRKRRDTLQDVIDKYRGGLRDELMEPPAPRQEEPPKPSALASLVDQFVGSKPAIPNRALEEKLYGVPFTEIEDEETPSASSPKPSPKSTSPSVAATPAPAPAPAAAPKVEPAKYFIDFDDEDLTGAVIANPMYGLDSDEEGQDSSESEDDPHGMRTSISNQSLSPSLTSPNRSPPPTIPLSKQFEQKKQELRPTPLPIRPDPPKPEKEVKREEKKTEKWEDAEEEPLKGESDQPGARVIPHLPLRLNSAAVKANQVQQEALLKRPSSSYMQIQESPEVQDSNDAVDGKHIKIYLAKKDFPIDIQCADLFLGRRYIFGTPNGLYQLDKRGNLLKLIANVCFLQITVLTEFGVMMALCIGKKSPHIRMYSLSLMQRAAQKEKAPSLFPFLKLKGTKHCNHYAVARSASNVYLVACMKKEIVLYLWAGYPQNQFMKIKDYVTPEKAIRVDPVITGDQVSRLIVQCPSRFILVNVDTSSVSILFESAVGRSVPFSSYLLGDEVLLSFHNFGCFVDLDTLQVVGERMIWHNPPQAVVPLSTFRVLCFSQKQCDVFSRRTGALLQTATDIEGRKVRFLLKQFDDRDVVIASKTGEASNVHIVRPAGQKNVVGIPTARSSDSGLNSIPPP